MNTPRGARETQPARTALAWQRTGLGLLLVAGLVVLGVLAPHRRRTSQLPATTGGPGDAPRAAALGTALVVLAAVCGLAAELVVRLG
jgi:putative membrane protein